MKKIENIIDEVVDSVKNFYDINGKRYYAFTNDNILIEKETFIKTILEIYNSELLLDFFLNKILNKKGEDYVEKKYQDRKIKSITTKNGGVDITYIDKNSNKTFTVSYNGVPEGFVRDIIENIDSYSYFDIKNKL